MNWRDQILQEFPSQIARLTLVADPDNLVSEEIVLQVLQDRGYNILFFENSISFRYIYESRYRGSWYEAKQSDLIVIMSTDNAELRKLPFDMVQIANNHLNYSLIDIFPNLDTGVIRELDRSHFDALYQAQQKYSPEQLGYFATCDFVMKRVFEIDADEIRQDSDLLRVLLRRHYQKQRIPEILDQRFIQILRQNQLFSDWPLEKIISNREAFFNFLQERWPIFLNYQVTGQIIQDGQAAYTTFAGPPLLPFDHKDVWVFIDNLFLEGILRPVPFTKSESLSKPIFKIGVQQNSNVNQLNRLSRLLEKIDKAIPPSEAKHIEWLTFAYPWAELVVLWQETKSVAPPEYQQQIQILQQKVDQRFLNWIQVRYGGLHNQPAIPPVMVHHIPRTMARYLETKKDLGQAKPKVALVVVDGMALDQWLIIRQALETHHSNLKFREDAIFSWLPSVTPVSRQAIFSGKTPMFYPETISSTYKEPDYWEQYWLSQGLPSVAIAYEKGLRDDEDIDKVEQLLAQPKRQVVGLVINKVDEIMHGMQLGTRGMHNQVNQWVSEQKFFSTLLNLLLDQGFGIFLTADHGNIEAIGWGNPKEGAVADLRGERVRVYPEQSLRTMSKVNFPDAIEWPPLGLPENYYALFAPNRMAFTQDGKMIVGHGGISLEEVIVPLIRIERGGE